MTPTKRQKASCGDGDSKYSTKHTSLHKERPKTTTQHDNMVATHCSSTTWYKHYWADNSTKGKKVETTIYPTKQPQLSVRVSINGHHNSSWYGDE